MATGRFTIGKPIVDHVCARVSCCDINKPNPDFPVYLQTSEDFSFANAALLCVPWKCMEFAQTAFF